MKLRSGVAMSHSTTASAEASTAMGGATTAREAYSLTQLRRELQGVRDRLDAVLAAKASLDERLVALEAALRTGGRGRP